MKLRSTKLYLSPIVNCTYLLDITFLIDPSQHALLIRLKDHIDINNKLRRTDRNQKWKSRKKVIKEPNSVLEKNCISDTESQTLDLMSLYVDVCKRAKSL